jgi:quinol monooxygenase YgiN
MLIAIAVHHAAPEYTGEFTDFMYKVIDRTSGAPGLLEFRVCRDPGGRYLAGFSRWESPDDFAMARPAIASLAPLRKPEWTTRPDDVITLVEAERRTG